MKNIDDKNEKIIFVNIDSSNIIEANNNRVEISSKTEIMENNNIEENIRINNNKMLIKTIWKTKRN